MHLKITERLACGLLSLAAAFTLAGCAGDTDRDLIASAVSYLEKNDRKAAIVQLKAAIQKNPQSGEARYLLGKALMDDGDVTSAVVELSKAFDLKYDDSLVLPPLARALLMTRQERKLTDLYARVTLPDRAAAADLKAMIALGWASQGQWDRSQGAVDAALQFDPENPDAKLLLARMTAARGDMTQALAIIDTVIAANVKRGAALNLKGELLWVGMSDRQGAMAAYRAAIQDDAKLLPAHASLIAILIQSQDLPAAKVQLEALRKSFPGHPETRFIETQLWLLENDFGKARESMQQLLKYAPDNFRVLQLAGAIEMQLGSLLLAETHLSKALQIAPGLPLARRLLAETQLRAGQPAKALVSLQPLFERSTVESSALALAAEAYLQSGDAARAETFYLRAVKASPTDPKVRTALAVAQIAKGNADAGFTSLEGVAATDPTSYADLALISARMRQGNLDEGLKAIERLKTKMPGKPLPLLLEGRIYGLRKDLPGARRSLEKAMEVDPVYFPAVAGLAALSMAEGKPEVAFKHFQDLLTRSPNNYSAALGMAEVRQRSGGTPEEVQKLLADAIRLGPGEVEPRLLLIDHHLMRGDLKAATSAAQQAVAAAPNHPSVLEALGRVQLQTGEVQQAMSSFGKLVAALPLAPEPHLRVAETHLRNRDYKAAEQSYRRALALRPGFAPATSGLIRIALAERRNTEALALARGVQQRWPNDPVGHQMLGEVHASMKEWDKSASAFRLALQQGPSPAAAIGLHAALTKTGQTKEAERLAATWEADPATDRTVITYLASWAMSAKRWTQAEMLYRRMLESSPDEIASLNNVAWLMVQQGKPGALALAERANLLQPQQPSLMDTLALALAAVNRTPEAIELQKKAVALKPDDPQLRLTLASLLLKGGDRATAKIELEKLSNLGTGFADQPEVQRLLKGM